MNQGFACSQTPSPKSTCLGCGRQIESGKLRLGTTIDYGDHQTYEWFHSQCFWEKCPYRSHLRGASGDRMTLFELVTGSESLPTPERTKIEQEINKAPGKTALKFRPCGLSVGRYDDISCDSGDYEVGENTYDLTNLICVGVFKYQMEVFVSIREYYKHADGSVAKATKRGITLTVDQWQRLAAKRVGINAALKMIGDEQDEPNKKDERKKKKNNVDNEDGELYYLQ